MRKKNQLDKKPLTLDAVTIRELATEGLVVVAGARAATTNPASGYGCCR